MRCYVEVIADEIRDEAQRTGAREMVTLSKRLDTWDELIADLTGLVRRFPNGEVAHVHICFVETDEQECGDHWRNEELELDADDKATVAAGRAARERLAQPGAAEIVAELERRADDAQA